MIAPQAEALSRAISQGLYPMAALAPRRPVRIALVGPDGVGKSTTIATLREWFQQELPQLSFEVRQWRPDLLPDLGVYLGKPSTPGKKTAPRRQAGRFQLLRVFYYFLDFLIGSWWKDRVRAPAASLIVYDRCALDMYVDPVRFGLKSSFATRLLWKLTPRPDLVVLLHDDPERIWQRKRELARHEMAEQLAIWLQLVESGDVDAVIQVNAGPEAVAARILNLTLDAIVRKNGIQPDRGHERSAESLRRVGDILTGRSAQTAFSSEPQLGMREAAQFAVLPSARNPRFLIPLAENRSAAQSLEIYNPQAFRARAGKRCFQSGLRNGLAQPFLRDRRSLWIADTVAHEDLGAALLHEHLREVLGQPDLACAVSIGTPNCSQKPVLQLMHPGGRVAGYAKVGWNERTIALVRNEASALRSLEDLPFSGAAVPRVLHSGWWRGYFVLVQSAPGEAPRESPSNLDERQVQFLIELQRCRGSLGPLPWSSLSPGLQAQLHRLSHSGFHYYSHLIETAVATCQRMLDSSLVPRGLGHGDFAPWNLRMAEDKLWVIDWEYGSQAYPPLWDLLHFHISSEIEIRNRSASQLYRELFTPGPVRDRLSQYCSGVAIPEAWIQPLLIAYLCEALHGNLSLHGTVPERKDQRVRGTLGRLLTIVCRPEERP